MRDPERKAGASAGEDPIGGALGRHTLQLLVGRGCFMATGFIASVLLARGLGPREYGAYGVIMSVLVWFEMLGSAGVPGATARLIAGEDRGTTRAVEGTAQLLLLTLSLVLFSVCWVLAPAVAWRFDVPNGAALFRLAILDLPLAGIYFAYQGILNGHRRFGTQSMCFTAYGLAKLAGILGLLAIGVTLAGALVVNWLATGCVVAYLLVKFPPRRWLSSPPLIRSLVSLAAPMGLYLAAFQLLLTVDLWLLKELGTTSADVVGVYVAAANVARALAIVPPALSGVVFASLAWALARGEEGRVRDVMQAATRFAAIILVPACVLLAIDAEAVMTLLYSTAYSSGGVYLRLQVIAFALMVILDVMFHALMVAGKQNLAGGVLLAFVPIAAAMNLVLIPHLGALGAATALLLAVGMAATVGAFLTYRRFGSLVRWRSLARVVSAGALTALVGAQIPAVGPWLVVKFVILLGLYGLLLALLKEVSRADLRVLALAPSAWDPRGSLQRGPTD